MMKSVGHDRTGKHVRNRNWGVLAGRLLKQFAGPALTVVVACLGLQGCVSADGGDVVAGPRAVDISRALIVPAPGGPTVQGVVEQRYSNAVEQHVLLSTAAEANGQNFFDIRMYGPMEWATGGRSPLPYRLFHAAYLGADMRAALPGVPLGISSLFLRNNYGPFGYAFGRTRAGDACLYGWQQIQASDAERANLRNSGLIQIRLRLCDHKASEKDLLSVMYGYTLTGSFNSEQWNPYGEVKNADAATGGPIYPHDGELSAAPVTVERPHPIRRGTPVRHVVARDADRPEDDQTTDRPVVDVPSPSGAVETRDVQDNSVRAKVVVPGPGCQNGQPQCN